MASSTRSIIVPTKEAAHPCPCGCAPCEGTCCHFDCIVRPRFFCGQLLTDTDLSALLKWARDRFGLSRYRHGWGVVCGLDVRCDPKRPAGIVVTPGYAINCCGNDIIVCEDASLDLSAVCREDKDPCADLRRRYEAVAPEKAHVLNRNILGGHLMGGGLSEYQGGVAEKARARVVDIYLRYDEMPSEPTTALGRGSCQQVSECEYSRTRESYKLTWEFGVEGSDPVQARATRWHEGYEKCLDVLKEFRARFTNGFPADDVRRWLVRWIDAHAQSNICATREAICRAPESYLKEEKNLVRLLFQLVLECRNAYLNCDCFGCDEDTGVPLARVWLMTDDNDGREVCRIAAIDPYPPYRRPIQPECWPAPLGSVNVGRFIWHRWEEVCSALNDLGVRVNPKEFILPATLVDLDKALHCNLFVKCDERRDALVYKTDFLGERVVGFCAATQAAAPDMMIEKSSNPTEARPGQSVTYLFKVSNTGNVALQVKVEDASLKLAKDLGMIEPGQSKTFEHPGTIPQGASGTITNTATATGTGGGQTITRSDAANITILKTNCPSINVGCPSTIDVGKPIEFKARLTGGDPNASVTYNWTVSAGTIKSGQGTPAILVDTTGHAQGTTVTATVEVGGLDPSCPRTANCATLLKSITPNCPTINMLNLSEITVGKPLEFTAKLTGGDPNASVTYNWTVSASTIQSGQGTERIVVDTTGLSHIPSLTAKVEIGGLDPSCPRTASGTTKLNMENLARKFDEYGDLRKDGEDGDSDENARLANFDIQLGNEPGTQGHIVVFAGRNAPPGEAQERVARAKDYLINTRGVDASRVVTLEGGVREHLTFELWIVPARATPPAATRDDLMEIAQIGPARAAKLNEAGIKTFADVASTPLERLKELVPEVGEDTLRGWIESAKSRMA